MITFAEFLKRAEQAKAVIRTSGHTTFVIANNVTVKVQHKSETPLYFLSDLKDGSKHEFAQCNIYAAMRALKLPRQVAATSIH